MLSWRERTWWSKEREWVNVKLVTDDLKRIEEKRRGLYLSKVHEVLIRQW